MPFKAVLALLLCKHKRKLIKFGKLTLRSSDFTRRTRHVDSFQTLVAFRHIILDRITFLKGLEPVAFDV